MLMQFTNGIKISQQIIVVVSLMCMHSRVASVCWDLGYIRIIVVARGLAASLF